MLLETEKQQDFKDRLAEAKKEYFTDLRLGKEADESAGKVAGYDEVLKFKNMEEFDEAYEMYSGYHKSNPSVLWEAMLKVFDEVQEVI